MAHKSGFRMNRSKNKEATSACPSEDTAPEHAKAAARVLEAERKYLNDYEIGLMHSLIRTTRPTERQKAKFLKVLTDLRDRKAGFYGRRHQRGYR